MSGYVRTCLSEDDGYILFVYLYTCTAIVADADRHRAVFARFTVTSVRDLVRDTLLDKDAFFRMDLPRMVLKRTASVVNAGWVCLHLTNGFEEYALEGGPFQ